MDIVINLEKVQYVYHTDVKTFIMSEKGIPFGTSYVIRNPKTGGSRKFEFTHSTGPEFDPTTRWVYKSEDGIQLEVCNDVEMVKRAADAYLAAKLRK
jgi:hypothetical protein